MNIFKKILIGASLLALSITSFSQESEPAATLASHGITFNEADYDIPEATDATYTTVIYIDGDAATDGTGTILSPWNTMDGKILTGNTAYLFKRGVYLNNGSVVAEFNDANVLFGAYGTGNRPEITFFRFRLYADNVTLRDLHFLHTNVDCGTAETNNSGLWIYNCDIEREQGSGSSNEGGVVAFTDDIKIIYNTIHGQLEDGVYINGQAGIDSVHVAYNYIYDVNRNWFETTTPSGDCIQLSGSQGNYIHHNVLDRFGTGNKFCLIARDAIGYLSGAPMRGLYEHNVMYMTSETIQPSTGLSFGGAGIYLEDPQATIIRYNKVTGYGDRNFIYSVSEGQVDIYANTFRNASTPFRSSGADRIYNNTFYLTTDLASGLPQNSFVSNNIFDDYDSRFDNGTNLFIDQEGASNLFVDAANGDFTPLVGSVSRLSADWDAANMDSDFNEDMNGTSFIQADNQFDIGAIQYFVAGACTGINIYFNGIVSPDTASRGIGSISQTIDGNGTSPYSFLWNDGNTSEDRTNLIAGTYSVTVTDDNGCTNDTSYVVNNITSVVDGNILIDSVNTSAFQSPNVGDNIKDNDILTKWAAPDIGDYATCYLDNSYQIDSFSVYMTDRVNNFQIETFYDGASQGVQNYTTSTGVNLSTFTLNQIADSLIIYNQGNEETSNWISLFELDLFGSVYSPSINDSIQVDFSDITPTTNWPQLNSSNTSVTANGITVYYSGEGSYFPGETNGIYPDDVAQENMGSGSVDSMWVVAKVNSEKVILEIYASVNAGGISLVDFYVNNQLTWGNFDLDLNPLSILTDTFDVVGDSVYITQKTIDGKVAFNAIRIFEYNDINPCDTTTINISGIIDTVSCNGGDNGAIDITVTGGDESYTYLWSNGETTQDIDTLTAANYSVTATDGNGCTGVQSFSVLQPTQISYSAVVNSDVICYGGNDGSATITPSGGVSPYIVSWDSLGVEGTQIDTLYRGDQYITITDANSCDLSFSLFIDSPDPILSSFDLTVITNDTNSTGVGSVSPFITGGTGAYTYLWDSGDTTLNISNKVAGDYVLTVTDANLCDTSFTYTIPNVIDICQGVTIVPNDSLKAATGTNANGEAYLFPSGGTAPYLYYWSSGENTSYIVDKIAAIYGITIFDGNNCQYNGTITIPMASTGDLDTISYAIDTKSSQWAIKINAGINQTNSRILSDMDTIIIGTDGPETWFYKTNVFIKKFSNDTTVYLTDSWKVFKIKANAAIREEDNTD